MIKHPTISVVMPLYNKVGYVGEAIRSVLEQTQAAAEIVVVDDGSTDGSTAAVSAFQEPAIRLLSQANAGVSVARNRGIVASSSEYIGFLDADDRYQPDFLAGIARLIHQFPNAAVFCSAYTCFWEDGSRIERSMPAVAPGAALLVENFYSAWCKAAFTCTNAIVVRRSLFDDPSLRFPPGEKLGEDQDLWFRIAERATVAYMNSPLVDYRMGVLGSATQASSVLEVLPCYRRLDERLASGAVPPRLRRGAQRLLASHLLNLAHTHMALGNLPKARALVTDHRARANPVYFLRTLFAIAAAGLRSSPAK
jgi:glycosyltransferase involved in cell wall biosynthesis